jgi:anti-sigma factor RsiW
LCREFERVQAHFDGELDAVTAAEVERHVEHCSECRSMLDDLERLRKKIRQELRPAAVPPELRARIRRALDQEASAATPRLPTWLQPAIRMRAFWAGALSGAGGAALAAALCFFVLLPFLRSSPLLDALVAAHVQSLTSGHIIDVASTDKHTVKPWFAGRADVSPVVADFESQGYRLVGGRADQVNHQRAAVVVYRHGPHLINVFAWAIDTKMPPRNATRNGYHLAFWTEGNLAYCAVSDTGWDELLGLARLMQDLGTRDARE